MLNEDSLPVLTISTLFYRTDYINSERCPRKFEVFSDGCRWTYSNLLCFLNEERFFINSNNSFTVDKSKPSKEANFRFISSENKKWIIFIKVAKTIRVFLSADLLRNKYMIQFSFFQSNLGSDNKIIKKVDYHHHMRFTKYLTNISTCSRFFKENKSIIYFSKYDFSKILNYFANRINIFGFEKNIDTESLTNYINAWSILKKKEINCIEDLEKEGVNGFLKLKLQKKVTHKRLQTFSYKDEEYYIISGVFLLPLAKSIFEDNPDIEIHGFLLDTTWRILPMYVTSIITVCFLNTSLPIGFTFSNGETKENYNYLLSVIESEFSIDFQSKIIESDQGKALIGLCQDRSIFHLKCIRHLLAGLKHDPYSYEIGQLVQCSSEFDLNNCADFFALKFTEICSKDPNNLRIINNSLKKIGLIFEYKKVTKDDPNPINQIIGFDSIRWQEVSKLKRIEFKMPSTTNSLEAMHGHLNSRTPRRNNFFPALLRVQNELSLKYRVINK